MVFDLIVSYLEPGVLARAVFVHVVCIYTCLGGVNDEG